MSSKEHFDRSAPDWDAMRDAFFSESLREAVLRAAGAGKGDLAADIGAASGFLAEALLESGAQVVAVNRSRSMVEVLNDKYGGENRFEARLGEAGSLPVKDGSQDVAMANIYLHHVENPAAAVKEMAAKLKPGGRLVATGLDSRDAEILPTGRHGRWKGFARHDAARWMREAGLIGETVEDAGDVCRPPSSCCGDKGGVSIFLARGVKPDESLAGQHDENATARRLFESKYFCAESVLMAVAEALGIDSPLIPAISTGFCGGLSRTDGLCGAAAGAVMGLGLAFGRNGPEDKQEPIYSLVNRFLGEFKRIYGSAYCTDILGGSLGVPEKRSEMLADGLLARTCNIVSGRAAAIALRLIRENEKEMRS